LVCLEGAASPMSVRCAGEYRERCQSAMIQTVEIKLRIPSVRVQRAQRDSPTIAKEDVRFIKRVELEGIPQQGDVLTMTIESSGDTFPCEVLRSDWHDDKNMFVIACRYARRTISEIDYLRLMSAGDWHVTAR
jgi:hypothetical protein